MSDQDVPKQSKHSEYHKRWKAGTLGPDLVQTYAHISKQDHARVQAVARAEHQRIPQIIGKLVRLGLDLLDLKQPEIPFRAPPPPPKTDIAALTTLILNSRFPEDTETTRFRILGVINLIHLETILGNTPTGNTIARRAHSHPSHMNFTARILEKRGLIDRSPIPTGGEGGKRAYGLRIREDAAAAFNQAHLVETGQEISEGRPPDDLQNDSEI